MMSGRDLDWNVLKQQIGFMTVCAISGGKAVRYDASTIDLPAGQGYLVRIHLAGNDTYTVSRMFKRGQKFFDKGTLSDVYCDQISDVAYAASCYVNREFGE